MKIANLWNYRQAFLLWSGPTAKDLFKCRNNSLRHDLRDMSLFIQTTHHLNHLWANCITCQNTKQNVTKWCFTQLHFLQCNNFTTEAHKKVSEFQKRLDFFLVAVSKWPNVYLGPEDCKEKGHLESQCVDGQLLNTLSVFVQFTRHITYKHNLQILLWLVLMN